MSNLEEDYNATTFATTTEKYGGLPFSQTTAIVVICILAPLTLFGILANTVTILVIGKSQKLRSVFSLFIISLSVSDLASALVSPIFMYRRTWGFDIWKIPHFFCQFSWTIHMWTNYVTCIHIVCFAALRLYAIAKPIKFRKINQLHAQISIAVIWFVTFFTGGLPLALMFGVESERSQEDGVVAKFPACSVYRSRLDDFKLYQQICYPIFFYLPIVLVTGISIAVGILFFRRKEHRKNNLNTTVKSISNDAATDNNRPYSSGTTTRRKKKPENETFAILQLSLIVGSFLIGYLPFTIYQLYGYAQSPKTHDDRINDWNFGISEYILLRFSECLNPIFYNLASRTMRAETFQLFRSACCWFRSN